VNGVFVNAIMYADDLIVMVLIVSDLNILLKYCMLIFGLSRHAYI